MKDPIKEALALETLAMEAPITDISAIEAMKALIEFLKLIVDN